MLAQKRPRSIVNTALHEGAVCHDVCQILFVGTDVGECLPGSTVEFSSAGALGLLAVVMQSYAVFVHEPCPGETVCVSVSEKKVPLVVIRSAIQTGIHQRGRGRRAISNANPLSDTEAEAELDTSPFGDRQWEVKGLKTTITSSSRRSPDLFQEEGRAGERWWASVRTDKGDKDGH